MPTRFYFQSTSSGGTPNISPANDAGWEIVTASRRKMIVKQKLQTVTGSTTVSLTVPITTTQDIAGLQWISEPLAPQTITGTFSFVMKLAQAATTNNATLAVVVRVISGDGGTVRGTLFSVFSTDTAFALTAATRIVNAQTMTSVTAQGGDVIVVEVGGRATAPSVAGTYSPTYQTDAATDFALTTALTTNLNPWCEFSNDLVIANLGINNYQSLKAGSGISTSGGIR